MRRMQSGRRVGLLVLALLVSTAAALLIIPARTGAAADASVRGHTFFSDNLSGASLNPPFCAAPASPLLTTITVTTTSNRVIADGACALREAIQAANTDTAVNECPAGSGMDTIAFNIPGAGVQTINLTLAPPTSAGGLPAITAPVIIDGFTQPGSSFNTPLIELNGTGAPGTARGLDLTNVGNCLIRGLIINRFAGSGVFISGATATGNRIQGNFIGPNNTGTAGFFDFLNSQQTGVTIQGGATGNFVGTDGDGTGDATEGNLVSSNTFDGVLITATGTANNIVAGNRIGTNRDVTAAIRNGPPGGTGAGVSLTFGVTNNLVGTNADGVSDALETNIISGNNNGVAIFQTGTSGNRVQGNLIGTNTAGTGAIPNLNDGVTLSSSVTNNIIGTNGDGVGDAIEGNLIAGNAGVGLRISVSCTGNRVAGNKIGTDITGNVALGNTFFGVLIGNQASNNVIGTNGDGVSDELEGNVISATVLSSGFGVGVSISGTGVTGNRVSGNLIGTNALGTAALPNGANGVQISSGAANTLVGTNGDGVSDSLERNVISGNASQGVAIFNPGATNIIVAGNLIGTNAAGTAALANQTGLSISGGATNNRVGTNGDGQSDDLERNIISGNTLDGVLVFTAGTTGNVFAGNYVGTNATGTAAIGNLRDGIAISTQATNNLVGTNGDGIGDAAEGNLISGNTGIGVRFFNAGTTGNAVAGNRIGTNADGTGDIGNGSYGVFIQDGASNIPIGGLAGRANIIAFNAKGVVVGSNAADTPVNNLISQNSIFLNDDLGIDLGNDGVTMNDTGDIDASPNNLQNFPILTSGGPIITGTLNSTPSTVFRIEFFASPVMDPSGFGEGQIFVGLATVTTDGAGNANIFFSSPLIVPGQFISSTATDVATSNTSEFSPTVQVLAPTATEFSGAKAVRSGAGVLIEWGTGLEVENLGFNVYREVGKQRTLLTPQPVAGSALVAASSTPPAPGHTYAWTDPLAPAGARYLIEDIDLAGRRTTHGPFVPEGTAGSKLRLAPEAKLLTTLGAEPGEGTATLRDWPLSPEADNCQTCPAARASEDIAATYEDEDVSRDLEIRRRALQKGGRIIPVPPALAARAAVKLYIDRDGWYRVTPEQLAAVAEPGGRVMPHAPQLFTGGEEVPLLVNPDGSVEFYGQGLDTPSTDERVYWLVTGFTVGRRVAVAPPVAPGPVSQADFAATIELRERSVYFSSLLNGEAENIFGPSIAGADVARTLNVEALAAPPGEAVLEVAVQGVTDLPHSVRVTLNGTEVGLIEFVGRRHSVASFALPAGLLREGGNSIALRRLGGTTDVSLLDYMRLTYRKQYRARANRLRLSLGAGRSARVSGFTTDRLRLFDLTDPRAPVKVSVSPQPDPAGGYAFNIPAAAQARTLLALEEAVADTPTKFSVNDPTDWRTPAHAADLLVITHRDFLAAVEPLAAWRRAQGLAVEVIDVEDVFDEFSDGTHTPQALRDFIQFAASRWQTPPRFVLLVGDSTWDPRNYLGRSEADFVPTRLIDTAQMETASDDWLVDFDGDAMPELSIGRLPVRTASEAEGVVAKIIAYDAAPAGPQRRALLVADTAFEAMSAEVGALLPAGVQAESINRSGGPTDAAVRARIISALNAGPLLVNYSGHGSVDVWTGARLLTASDAAALTNGGRLPLMVLLTCLNGYAHDANIESLGEAMLLRPQGGAVAVWSSTGMTTSDAQRQMARRLYGGLFGAESLRLGEAIVAAKAATLNPDVRRTWLLLGDPTMRLRRD